MYIQRENFFKSSLIVGWRKTVAMVALVYPFSTPCVLGHVDVVPVRNSTHSRHLFLVCTKETGVRHIGSGVNPKIENVSIIMFMYVHVSITMFRC